MVESVRGYGAQFDIFTAQIEEYQKSQTTLATMVRGIAEKYDPESIGTDPESVIKGLTSQAIGKTFTFGSA
jgi:hypothetical protein